MPETAGDDTPTELDQLRRMTVEAVQRVADATGMPFDQCVLFCLLKGSALAGKLSPVDISVSSCGNDDVCRVTVAYRCR